MVNYQSPDLTQHPPRSPRTKLGGYVVLPRILDKARAHLAGKLGEYRYDNPLDRRLFLFLGLNAEQFLEGAKSSATDTEMLAWVTAHAQPTRQQWEIAAWSHWLENMSAGDAYRHKVFAEHIEKFAPEREDIQTSLIASTSTIT